MSQTFFCLVILQHVLEHGKPHERCAVIKKLAGQIVKMSQQKFASNVVEKCLAFGGPADRQILIHEMLGSTDENEPLQVWLICPLDTFIDKFGLTAKFSLWCFKCFSKLLFQPPMVICLLLKISMYCSVRQHVSKTI